MVGVGGRPYRPLADGEKGVPCPLCAIVMGICWLVLFAYIGRHVNLSHTLVSPLAPLERRSQMNMQDQGEFIHELSLAQVELDSIPALQDR